MNKDEYQRLFWILNNGGTPVCQKLPTLSEVEKVVIQSRLRKLDGNKTHTAESLGISLKTLYNRLAEYRKEDKAQADLISQT